MTLRLLQGANKMLNRQCWHSVGVCWVWLLVVFYHPTLDSQSTTARGLWPSVKELADSDRDWQTVADLKPSAQEFDLLRTLATSWINKHCSRQESPTFHRDKIMKLTAKRIRLAETATNALVVSEDADWEGDSQTCGCDQHLNCRRWIVATVGSQGVGLLEYTGFGIVPLQSSTNGYFDIVTGLNRRLGIIDLRLWRFDGRQYRAVRCATKQYPSDLVNGGHAIDEIDRRGVLTEHRCR
jgi:hypothetical protein